MGGTAEHGAVRAHSCGVLLRGLLPALPGNDARQLAATPPHGRDDAFLPFALFPLLFITVFFVPAALPAWLEAARTRYVLTDRRAVIHGWRREAEIDLALSPYVELERPLLGTTTIYFGQRDAMEAWAWGWWGGRPKAPAFRAIPDGERVYRLVTEARERLRKPA